jgi:hypothetical protein
MYLNHYQFGIINVKLFSTKAAEVEPPAAEVEPPAAEPEVEAVPEPPRLIVSGSCKKANYKIDSFAKNCSICRCKMDYITVHETCVCI